MAIMDDNGLSAINNRNEKFIIYNLNSSLYASEVVKCTGLSKGYETVMMNDYYNKYIVGHNAIHQCSLLGCGILMIM